MSLLAPTPVWRLGSRQWLHPETRGGTTSSPNHAQETYTPRYLARHRHDSTSPGGRRPIFSTIHSPLSLLSEAEDEFDLLGAVVEPSGVLGVDANVLFAKLGGPRAPICLLRTVRRSLSWSATPPPYQQFHSWRFLGIWENAGALLARYGVIQDTRRHQEVHVCCAGRYGRQRRFPMLRPTAYIHYY